MRSRQAGKSVWVAVVEVDVVAVAVVEVSVADVFVDEVAIVELVVPCSVVKLGSMTDVAVVSVPNPEPETTVSSSGVVVDSCGMEGVVVVSGDT